MNNYTYDVSSQQKGLSRFFAQTYLKMGIGLFISMATGLIMWKFLPVEYLNVVVNPMLVIVAGIIEIILALSIRTKAFNGNSSQAMGMFIAYSILNAIVFVPVFAIYSIKLIIEAFAITALSFVGMSILGYTTKKDLSAWGNFLFMALIGGLIAMLINLFFHNPFIYFIVNMAMILVFALYMAFDTQYMRKSYYEVNDEQMLNGLSTFWALQLYMDIVNMFINLLQVLGMFSDND